ncbi:MAG: flagellar type III secretion system protein FlhB [Leptospiraceae bacterium]|nr:flagellar type III secretion system protein FlhB [Leptospiraceae bacterium]MCP5499559.1 flagellar type III secretion system protein FlhB [Leptospiraceae bacterium]
MIVRDFENDSLLFLKQAGLNPFVIDLQLFSAEDEGRTEEPSDRRRKEEREKGNVPRSQELPGAVVLLASVIAFYFFGKHLFINAVAIITRYFGNFKDYDSFTAESFANLMKVGALDVITLVLPALMITLVAAIVGNVVQVGFLFTPKAVGFNFKKIIPNFKKVLPTRQTIFNLIKSLAKVVLIGWISYIIISFDFLDLLLLGQMGIKEAMQLIFFSSFKLFFFIGIFLVIIGIADFFYNKYEYEENLKITPSEAKREHKEAEGDKTLLNRRRNMMREFIRKGMLQKVKTADVVIVNPTHFSVALSYDPKVHDAPVVVAKGMDEFALMIRRIAKNNNVPIIEDRMQARMLYDEAELDMPIPVKFFRAVSLIIARLDKYRRVA